MSFWDIFKTTKKKQGATDTSAGTFIAANNDTESDAGSASAGMSGDVGSASDGSSGGGDGGGGAS